MTEYYDMLTQNERGKGRAAGVSHFGTSVDPSIGLLIQFRQVLQVCVPAALSYLLPMSFSVYVRIQMAFKKLHYFQGCLFFPRLWVSCLHKI